MRTNFINFQKNSHVFCLDIYPDEVSLNLLNQFFDGFCDTTRLEEFYAKKHTNALCPSDVDLMLMALSKELTIPLISNDYDITFFRDEFYEKNLVGEIISFNSIQYS